MLDTENPISYIKDAGQALPAFHLPSLEFPMAIQCDCYLTRLVGVDKPCPHFLMHDLPRIEIREDMTQDLKDLLEGYNDQCERVEDLWTELDLQALEQAASRPKRRKKSKRKTQLEELERAIQAEIAAEIENLGDTEI